MSEHLSSDEDEYQQPEEEFLMNSSHSDDDFVPPHSDDEVSEGTSNEDPDPQEQDTDPLDVPTKEEEDRALAARKADFYAEVDRKIATISKDHRAKHIMTDEQFNEIMNFFFSIRNVSQEKKVSIMRSYPHKIAYKWLNKYDVLVINTSRTLIFKQGAGLALDSCQRVANYGRVFDVVREIHELETGNDHPKAKSLYKRVNAKYGKSIPRWVCEIFPKFCPVCVRAKSRRKPKAGHQPLLTRGMGVRAQIDLIDFQSMPDGSYNYVLDYQDHGIKFCQLRPLRQKTHEAVAVELINIFSIFGPPSILQADNGTEFSQGATKSKHVQLDGEVSLKEKLSFS